MKGLRDRGGRLLFDGTTDEQALEGHDVYLTLDEGIQHVAEQEIDAAQRTYETKGASIVVLNPNTGEILAIASTPGYNPNDYSESEADSRRDRAVTDRFEPGSVMKPFTIAAALSAGTLKPTDSGLLRARNLPARGRHHPRHPLQRLADADPDSRRSSNVGALKIGLGVGEPALYAMFRKFRLRRTHGTAAAG